MTDDKQTDRQTDHATKKRVGTGGIACATRAIPPDRSNKTIIKKQMVAAGDQGRTQRGVWGIQTPPPLEILVKIFVVTKCSLNSCNA